MSQHFLLSPSARSLSIAKIAALSTEDAAQIFNRLRWPATNGLPVCPRCATGRFYVYRSRAVFKCGACGHQFTATSGTFLAQRKMPLKTYLLALALFVTGGRGKSSIQLSHEADLNYRTAWSLGARIRAALLHDQESITLSGEVEIDGAFIGGHFVVSNMPRPGGKRLVKGNFKNRRVIVVARERNGRAITFAGNKESEAREWIRKNVAPGSTIIVDEAHAWDNLKVLYETVRVSHKHWYSFKGQSTNQAESFHARMRRHHSTHGHFSAKYLADYAAEIAWRENTRRMTSADKFADLFAICFRYTAPPAAVASNVVTFKPRAKPAIVAATPAAA